MAEWRETTLGEVADVVGGGTPNTKNNTYWGGDVLWLTPGELTKRDGQVVTSTERRITAAGLAGSSAKLLPKDSVLLTSRATVGAVGIAGQPMATNQGFQSLICHEDVLPSFLMRWVQANRIEFTSRASGSTFPEISAKKIKRIPIILPPLDEQRRIVDVMAAVDAQIEALEAERVRGERVLRQVLSEHFQSVVGDQADIADLCTRIIGGVWGSPEGEGEVDVLALGPRIYSPGTADFVTDGSPTRSVSKKQYESRLVQPDDIILERSGGSPEQPVGRVVIAGNDLAPCIPTDFQRLLRPDPERVLPRYLFWRLRNDWHEGMTLNFSRRTTGITNLSVKDYLARSIPLPSLGVQEAFVTQADAVYVALRDVYSEIASLRSFRSALLTSLLNQEIEIPESYDELVGVPV